MKKIKDMFFDISCWIENNHRSLELFLTIIAIAVATDLLYETRKQVKIGSDALAYADTSNRFTRQSLELAERNYIIENRAWVGICQENITYGFLVYVKNFGKTPAESLCIGKTAFFSNTPPSKRPYVIMDRPTSMSPDEQTKIDFPQLTGENNGKGTCYYGIITYTDIYGRRDTTEFMYMDNVRSTPQLQRIGINRMK
jgi:hypothetical protein